MESFETGTGKLHTESAKFKQAFRPLNANAATSCAWAAISAVGDVPSHILDFLLGSHNSHTHMFPFLLLTPLYWVSCLLKLPPTDALLRPIQRPQNFPVGLDGPLGLLVRRWRTLWCADRMGIRRKWIRITKLIEEVHLNLQWEKEVLVIQLRYRSRTGHGRGGYDLAESYRYQPRFWTLVPKKDISDSSFPTIQFSIQNASSKYYFIKVKVLYLLLSNGEHNYGRNELLVCLELLSSALPFDHFQLFSHPTRPRACNFHMHDHLSPPPQVTLISSCIQVPTSSMAMHGPFVHAHHLRHTTNAKAYPWWKVYVVFIFSWSNTLSIAWLPCTV